MALKGKFWYSEKQRKAEIYLGRWTFYFGYLNQRREPYHQIFAKLTDGRIVEYTEMKSGQFIDNKPHWDDAVYLGEGEFHHQGDPIYPPGSDPFTHITRWRAPSKDRSREIAQHFVYENAHLVDYLRRHDIISRACSGALRKNHE